MQYYKYWLMPRTGEIFNTIHRLGRLFQQYVVDMYSKIEFSRLQYLRIHQSQLCADLYQGLANVVLASDGQADGSQLGKKIILPSSLQVDLGTNISCTKMQWVLYGNLANQISLWHLHVTQDGKK